MIEIIISYTYSLSLENDFLGKIVHVRIITKFVYL